MTLIDEKVLDELEQLREKVFIKGNDANRGTVDHFQILVFSNLSDLLATCREALRYRKALEHLLYESERCSCSGYDINGQIGYRVSEDLQRIVREALSEKDGEK